MNTWVILLAAGQGRRLAEHGPPVPKQFFNLHDLPLFWHSALTFSHVAPLRGIIFVFPPGDAATGGTQAWEERLRRLEEHSAACGKGRLGLPRRIAFGGARRQDSVANGLEVLPADCDHVLIHDSARPFVSAALIGRVLHALEQGHEAVIPGTAVTDTIKSVDASGRVAGTLERKSLCAVQTPQGFSLPLLRRAHRLAVEQGWEATDDASLVERCACPVQIVQGENGNHKITTPTDLELLDRPLRQSEETARLVPCTGLGYDVHRYGGERPLILGGVPIRCDLGIVAHSDGDTLLHALMDALLGCIGGGDIGRLFPDDDPSFHNISSGILLAEVLERTRSAGLVITHVDSTIIAQIPRIAPHAEAIAANVAKQLGLPRQAVNVKATTEEHLGFTGEKKGLKVLAQVSALRPAPSTA